MMQRGTVREVFLVFLRLGLTAFGGPIAHIGYFRTELVERRKWLDDVDFADLVAMCQFLPGPASSQVGMAIGLIRAGYPGMVAAWIAFTLPSAIAMFLFARGLDSWGEALGPGMLHGLKIAAVAIVALALLGMARSLAPDLSRATIAVTAALLVLIVPNVWGQLFALALAAMLGATFMRREGPITAKSQETIGSRRIAVIAFLAFVLMLAGLPLLAAVSHNEAIGIFGTFYRTGSLVFGGGHVVLPMLQADLVASGAVGKDSFLAGYGAVQAVPGPLFTFATYLGAEIGIGGSAVTGAVLCTLAIFLPSLLLIPATLPFWHSLRRNSIAQAALRGINAAVVGLLLAAFYDPVWTTGVSRPTDFAFALIAFLCLLVWRMPPWLVVAFCAIGGAVSA